MTDETIFAAALEKTSPAARAAHLDSACAGDPEQRARVERLLAAHAKASGFLERSAAGSLDPTCVTSAFGDDGPLRLTENSLAFLGPSTRPDSLGRLGHYEVLELLGRGGFGIVLRAFDESLHRVVAVKVLSPEMAATSPARKRFLREARASAPIRHENVVQVYAIEETPLPYIVMEFIPGRTLQDYIDGTGPLGSPDVVRIGVQIARGLAVAHELGLVHRDIKPANILLEGGIELRVKITDFGLARAVDDASLTASGTVAGTPMYMAPEQARGEKLDHRADLFSLGSVLYTMCTGHPPFRANGALAVLKRVCDETPRPIPELIPETPRWLCDIVSKLLAKNPAERFQTAQEVAELLTRSEMAPPLPESKAEPERKAIHGAKPRSRSGRKLVLAACVLLLAVATALGLHFATKGDKPVDSIAKKDDEQKKDGTPLPVVVPSDPIGNPPPAKDAFPGKLVFYNVFDDPKLSLSTTGDGPPRTVIRDGKHTTTIPDGKGIRRTYLTIPQEPVDSSPAGAFAMRVRAEAGTFWLNFRQREQPDRAWWLLLNLDPDGRWQLTSRESRTVKGKREFFPALGTLADSGRAVPELAGHWVNIAGRWSETEYELFLNGKRVAGGPVADPVGAVATVRPAGLQLGIRRDRDGPAALDLDYVAVWDLNDPDRKPAELALLQGEWDVPAEEFKGAPLKEELIRQMGKALTFANDRMTMHRTMGDGRRLKTEGTIRLDPSVSPKSWDFTGTDYFGEPVQFRGLYEVNGDSLRMVYNARKSAEGIPVRPTDFRTASETQTVILHAKRRVDADRKAAEYVLSIGGIAHVRLGEQDQEIKAAADLPKEPFTLTRITIRYSKVTDAELAPFAACKNLMALNLGHTKVGDAGVAHFKDCKQLREITLADTKVGDAGLGHFKDCKDLKFLGLGQTMVSDEGLAHLQDCKNLLNVHLTATNVTDAGVRTFVKDRKALVHLDLRGTKVTKAGVEEFTAALPKCKIEWDGDPIEPKK